MTDVLGAEDGWGCRATGPALTSTHVSRPLSPARRVRYIGAMPSAFQVLSPLLVAVVASAVLTPLVRSAAKRLGVYARPASDRWHRQPVPLLGGVAIVGAVAIGVGLTAEWRPLLPLLVCSGLMFALGSVDDIWKVKPAPKLVAQMAVAAAFIYLAPDMRLTGSTVVDHLLALAWIVGITNAFNLLDNIDGLAAGVAAIAGFFYLVVLLPEGPMASALAAFVGGAIGFLIYNHRPASIFMGDAGSLFLGSFLAGVGLRTPGLNPQGAPVVIPLLILLVPIFDTLFVTLTRSLSGRSAFIGRRDHTSHRLVGLGVSETRAVLTLYGLAALGGLVALSLQHVTFGYAALLIGLCCTVLVGLGTVLGHVDVAPWSVSREAPHVTDIRHGR